MMVKRKFVQKSIRDKVIVRWKSRANEPKHKLFFFDNQYINFYPNDVCLVSAMLFRDFSDIKIKNDGANLLKDIKNFVSSNRYENEINDFEDLESIPEYLLKSYLIECGSKYGIKVLEDLDKTQMMKHGDVKGLWKEKKVAIEVEKHDSDFLKHKHEINESGEYEPGKIDLLFSLFPGKINFNIPIIYADESHFLTWVAQKKRTKQMKDSLFFHCFESIRRRLTILPYSFRDYCTSEGLRNCIYPKCEKCSHFLNIDFIRGTEKWIQYQIIDASTKIIFDLISKSDLLKYKSYSELVDEGVKRVINNLEQLKKAD